MAANQHIFGSSLQQILADRGSDLGVKQVPDWLTEICKLLKECNYRSLLYILTSLNLTSNSKKYTVFMERWKFTQSD